MRSSSSLKKSLFSIILGTLFLFTPLVAKAQSSNEFDADGAEESNKVILEVVLVPTPDICNGRNYPTSCPIDHEDVDRFFRGGHPRAEVTLEPKKHTPAVIGSSILGQIERIISANPSDTNTGFSILYRYKWNEPPNARIKRERLFRDPAGNKPDIKDSKDYGFNKYHYLYDHNEARHIVDSHVTWTLYVAGEFYSTYSYVKR
jgi:hypothetical protein